MDQLTSYREIITNSLEAHANVPIYNGEGLQKHLIIDQAGKHYQLLLMGWKKQAYVFKVLFHLTLADGKVWLQHNGTDMLIADELIAAGIAREDIRLGF